MFVECKAGRSFMGRIERGADLLPFLTNFCREQQIVLAHLNVIGAVEEARLGWYDQRDQHYTEPLHFTGGYEIVSCPGTVSLLDDLPQVHAHMQLSGPDGVCYGGHVYEGTFVYNAEFTLVEQVGTPLRRGLDSALNAPVWFPQSEPKDKSG